MKKNKNLLKYLAVFLAVFTALSFSGCTQLIDTLFPQDSYEPPQNSLASSTPSAEPIVENSIKQILEAGHSDYGFSSLDESEQKAYIALRDAFFTLEKTVVIEDTALEDLDKILLYMENDYPLLNWVDNQYTYQKTLNQKLRLTFKYKKEHDDLVDELSQIADAANEKIKNIPSELADFDKAIISHDALLSDMVYNKEAANKSDAIGAFLDKQAACIGYAKAYQYLLCKMGIDALIIYGNANEPHAWNALKLGDSYYFADPTWNDIDETDGTSYVSHEYTFLSKKQLLKTHDMKSDEWNYPIPECVDEDMNFALQKGFYVQSNDLKEVIQKLDAALSYALANNSSAFQIAFENEEFFYNVIDRLDNGELDSAVYKMCEERSGKKAVARSSNNKLFYLTYIMGEEKLNTEE